jgi:exodeoxyribonuclease VII large subunit
MPEHIKLSDLTRKIESAINNKFSSDSYWVVAETIEVSPLQSAGHRYLKLVEKEQDSKNIITKIDATIWRDSYAKIQEFERVTGQKFKDNIQILVNVKVEYHIQYGLKLNILDIDHSFTIGNLELARKLVLKKLIDENKEYIQLVNGEYITKNKKLELNPVIQSIALISAGNTKGHFDFMDQILKNKREYKFFIDHYHTQVQGQAAASSIVSKLIQVYETKKPYDAVVILRGGGDQVDYMAFNTYELSRAIARFPIPIITGIGHGPDESICDMMAKIKTNVPLQAATTILVHNRNFEENIIEMEKSMVIKTRAILSNSQLNLNKLNSSIATKSRSILTNGELNLNKLNASIATKARFILSNNAINLHKLNSNIVSRTKDFISQHKQSMSPIVNAIIQKSNRVIDSSNSKIKEAIFKINLLTNKKVHDEKGYLGHYIKLIEMLRPQSILKRGYSIIYFNGKAVTNPEIIPNGSSIKAVLLNGEIISTVTEKKQYNESES